MRVSSPEDNAAELVSTRNKRKFQQLKSGFLKVFPAFGRKRDMTALFDQCADDILDSWCSKRTLRDIQKSIAREVVDQDVYFTRTFLKTQVVRKSEKWFGPAKPGQIVTQFPMAKTFRDAVFALALERVVLAECPSHVYLHLRRTTSELASWCSRHLTTVQTFTETDYTAWDSGVDGAFVQFDSWLLSQIGVPKEYTRQFCDEAIRTRFWGGNLGIMQHSGSRYTFLFNTLNNLALTNCTYADTASVPQAFGGDDSLLGARLGHLATFSPKDWKMAPKVQHTTEGHLFGHHIRHGTLSYDYEYMSHRLDTAIISRPKDTDFYRSFCDQMVALPYPEDPQYARVFDALVTHCRSAGVVLPALAKATMIPSSFTSDRLYDLVSRTVSLRTGSF